ncbi:MAG: adenine methyltransferase [Planctomyces sp.]|nr:adenine methyltransferase [Planctomyces sp.]
MTGITKPIKYPGGKAYLAEWIIGLMPEHVRYVETHFGSGAVLFAKPCDGISEVVNDIDIRLICFWVTLADPVRFEAFRRVVEATPLCEKLFRGALLKFNKPDYLDRAATWEIAFLYFVMCRMSRQANLKDYVSPTSRTRRGMNENVSAWLSAVEGLPEVHERLKRVEIRNSDAVKMLALYDRPGTHFYLDPPYLHETRTDPVLYKHEMTVDQHVELLDAIANLEHATFQLSGYPAPLYEQYATEHGWRCEQREIDNKMSRAAVKPKKTECLWMNY